MGESSAQTVREIEEIRGDLDGKVRQLENRLPAAGRWLKRGVGILAGGGTGGTVAWFVVRRVRSRRQQKAKPKAADVVRQPEVFFDEITERLRDGQWKPYAAYAGAMWVVLKLAELRQLRRLSRALVTSRAVPVA